MGGPASRDRHTALTAAGQRSGTRVASFGARAAALVIDLLIMAAIAAPLIVAGTFIFGQDPKSGQDVVDAAWYSMLGVWLAVVALYGPLLTGRHGERNGQTLGKQALGIRVARPDGAPIGRGRAFAREFGCKGLLYACGWAVPPFGFIALAVAYLMVLPDPRNRALHDLICGTRVLRA
jgi:uncharacterized RDD family membrane protein YckC